MEVTAGMKELLTYIARNLVDHPDAVSVTEHKGESETVLELRVAPEDMGKVIGRQGRIAKEIRTLMREVKIVPWCDSPEFLLQFGTLYLDGTPVRVRAARVHKGNVLAALEGVADVNAAMALKGKIVSIDRSGVVLPEGRHFIADLLGLEVLDAGSGEKLGVVADVLTPPAHEVYVVKGEHEYMIPAVDEFLAETNVEGGYIKVRLIEGMRTDV